MIVGCYTLHLYCENNDAQCHYRDEFPHEYNAETGGECRAQARRAGWKINLRARTAICPKCNKAKQEKK